MANFTAKHLLFLATVSFLAPTVVHAQYNEAGITVGVSVYKGDLADRFQPTEFRSGFGVQLRRNFSPHWAGRINLGRGVLTADDNNSISPQQRMRNLRFRTEYIELIGSAEYNLTRFDILDLKGAAPFLSLGFGVAYFNPQAMYQGSYYDLQPLGTEGQGLAGYGKKYSKLAIQTPIGLGYKWAFGTRVVLLAEAALHLAYTDYLDDVSGNYADADLLHAANPRAAQLAFRTPELFPDQSQVNPGGTLRGDNHKFDRFFAINIGLSFNLCDKYSMEWNDDMRIYDEPKPASVKRKKGFKIFKKKKKLEGIF